MYKSILEIPIGKVAQHGKWIVSRWGVDEFDLTPIRKTKGGVFADGQSDTSIIFALTAEATEKKLSESL